MIYGIGHVATRFITFLLLPYYTNVFSTSEYGVISLAYAFIGFLIIIYRYGMDTALMKFSVQKTGVLKDSYISNIFIIQIITAIIFSGLLYLLRDSVSEVLFGINRPRWVVFISLILFLDLFWNLPLLLLRSQKKAISFISISLLNVILTMGFNIYFISYLKLGVEGVFASNFISSFIVFLLCIPYLWKNIYFKYFDKSILSKLVKFSIPFLPAGIFTMMMELSDRYIIDFYMTTSDVGIYSAGKKIGTLGLVVVMAFNMGWTPYFLGRIKAPNAKKDFSEITSLFLFALGLVCLIISLFIPELMTISFNDKYIISEQFWGCKSIVSSILLGYYFFGLYVVQSPGVYAVEKTNFVPLFRLFGALGIIILGLILTPYFGLIGLSYAVVFSYFLMSASIYVFNHKFYKIRYKFSSVFYPILFLIISQFNMESLFLRVSILLTYLLGWYYLILNKNEKNYIKEQI